MYVNHKKIFSTGKKFYGKYNTQFTVLQALEALKLLGLLFRAFPNCPSRFLRSKSMTLCLF